MLALSIRPGERIHIGNEITVMVCRVTHHDKVMLGIDAPRSVRVDRDKVFAKRQANGEVPDDEPIPEEEMPKW